MPKTVANYFGTGARKAAETLAFADVVNEVGPGESEYKTLYQDYEQRGTLEARLVKAADVIDLLIQAYALERAGAKGLDEFWQAAHDADFLLPTIAQGVIEEMVQALLDARGKI